MHLADVISNKRTSKLLASVRSAECSHYQVGASMPINIHLQTHCRTSLFLRATQHSRSPPVEAIITRPPPHPKTTKKNKKPVWSPCVGTLTTELTVYHRNPNENMLNKQMPFKHSFINIYTFICFRLCGQAARFLFQSGSWTLSGLWPRVNIRNPVKRR